MFREAPPKPKSVAPETLTARKKATIRFTDQQWRQLRKYLYEKDTTLQALVIASLADKLTSFDA